MKLSDTECVRPVGRSGFVSVGARSRRAAFRLLPVTRPGGPGHRQQRIRNFVYAQALGIR